MLPVTGYDETIAAREALPPDQRAVYDLINDFLYAEPGFSDTEGQDLARGSIYTAQQIGGYISALINAGLVYVEATEVNGRPVNFVHSYAHDYGWVRDGKLTPDRDPEYL